MSLLAVIPGLIALLVCFKRGPSYAMLTVYLPVLFLLPDGLRWPFSGHLTLAESALLPIALFFLARHALAWRWSFTDFLVISLWAMEAISEYVNFDIAHARNLALDLGCTTLLPYMLAKGLFERERLGAQFAKRVAICAAVVAIVSVYEFRMGVDLFERPVLPLFSERSYTPELFRYAYARIQGPWAQPILAGLMFAGAYRLTRWLEWSGNWRGNVPYLPISKTLFCEILLIGGSIMTVSRGPWMGAIAGGFCVALCRARHRLRFTAVSLAAVLLIGGPLYSAFTAYVSVDRLKVASDTQASAAYRYQLLEHYVQIAEERPTFGWGSMDFPRVAGLDSIDNHYLLIALDAGLYAFAILVTLMLWMIVRLLRFALKQPRGAPAMVLAANLLGIIVVIAVSITTVWLGAQTQPLLYLTLGWSEALLLAGAGTAREKAVREVATEHHPVHRFARVMV